MEDAALKNSDSIKSTGRIGFKLVDTEKKPTKSQLVTDFKLHVQPSQTYIDFERGNAK